MSVAARSPRGRSDAPAAARSVAAHRALRAPAPQDSRRSPGACRWPCSSVMVVAIFPSISASPQLDQLIESYPEALKEAFGFSAQSFTQPRRATSPGSCSA